LQHLYQPVIPSHIGQSQSNALVLLDNISGGIAMKASGSRFGLPSADLIWCVSAFGAGRGDFTLIKALKSPVINRPMLTQNPDRCIIKLWEDILGEAKMNDLYRRILTLEAPGGQPAWVQIVAPTVMLPVLPEHRRGPALSG
ncbi:hypothetical protein J7M22_09365, partial [Candidatus Poribacteria bacterium]|nr:hypothetical protein [Candidatus Poribacteria bacterium]